ncbi:alpha-amylase family glycosyl hydrolase [Saccharicrinis aurantiacus]|uniref:alpha-amylase family glycosyl hydrolase n=1 Tax=Saccharicrinis aurantiacus TaxID=1849719 RepID=UPI00249099F8|nr:alpha-amylase family glycosyl hydrolase [Saccharicrinis aurantiacus]
MNRIYTLISFLCMGLLLAAQVTTNPNPPVDNKPVTITFNAAEGNAELKGYTGDVYAHTGVITDKSSDGSDWKYVIAEWTENTEKAKLTSIGNDIFTLEMPTSINAYYGVPEGEQIKQMAFVFRNADGSKVGKTSTSGDIFVDVTTLNLTLDIISPAPSAIFAEGDAISIQITSENSTSIKAFVNNNEVGSSSTSTLDITETAGVPGTYTLKAQSSDGTTTLEKIQTYYVREDVVEETMPSNLRRGVNKVDNSSITFVLFAPEKEFVHVIGEFNDWTPSNEYMMKKDGDYFWLTLDGLVAETEYAFQFYIDGEIRIADPYTTKTLDPDDKWIDDSVYPGLKEYPSDKTEHVASLFTINEDEYTWKVASHTNPDPEQLVIYELHIRDFTEEGTIKAVTAKMDYFVDLGINAIELMPFNEFEGNDSWGYNPSFYFATDKAYGTANDYKAFIDACHENGISVIMDHVLNHSFGQSPFARMYLNDENKPSANNPWYNTEHNMAEPAAQWGYDFNHESVDTKELVDSICSYWISEFKIDGYRFDFTKGFTNTSYPVGDWASAYDASRIAILKRMTDEIRKRKSDAIISFEHLSDNDEEKELADYGILMWGNHNHNMAEAVMGYNENGKSDFSWASYQKRGWDSPHIINYIESHDEERIMYKAQEYGASSGDYNVKDLSTGLERSKAAAAFIFSVPGPNMIWQFGELGYDYSINTCTDGSIDEGCRTGRKPIKWDYAEDTDRMNLYKVYAQMATLKKEEPVFSTDNYSLDVSDAIKQIELNYNGSDVRLVGNFGTTTATVSPSFSSTGIWYRHFRGDEIEITDLNQEFELSPGKFIMFTEKKLIGFGIDTSTDELEPIQNVRISPTLVESSLTINFSNQPANKALIYNLSGSVIKQFIIDNNIHTENLSELPSGIYLIKFEGGDSNSAVKKFIKR